MRTRSSRRSAERARLFSKCLLPAALGLLLLVAPASAITGTDDPAALAAASLRNTNVLSSAVFDVPPGANATAVATEPVAGFPEQGADYLVMSSGDATLAPNASQAGITTSPNGGGTRGEAGDLVSLRLNLTIPAGVNCISLKFRFFSEEYPEYVGSIYNDGFLAELDPSTPWTMSGGQISAPDNFAFMPGGAFVSINSAPMTAENAAGTAYGGGTELLSAATPVSPGVHGLVLSVWDGGDTNYDSAVFVDDIAVFTVAPGTCVEGAVAPPPDTAAPDTTINADPGGSSGPSTSFAFTANEDGSTFECRLDGGAWIPCFAPDDLSGLSSGSHTYEVRATDLAGNIDATPASHTWTVDATPPDTALYGSPPGVTQSTSAGFGFSSSEAGSNFECRLDSGPWTSCTTPDVLGPLADGDHGFEVRAIDALGNVDPTPATRSWTIDTVAPAAPAILSGPPADTTATTGRFSLAGEPDATVECRLDGGGWYLCPSSFDLTGLALGDHLLQVRQSDAAGNVSPVAQHRWTVGATPAGPPGHPRILTGTVGVRSPGNRLPVAVAEGGSVPTGCTLDAGLITRCTVEVRVGGHIVGRGVASFGAGGVLGGPVQVHLYPRMRARLARAHRVVRATFVFNATVRGRSSHMTVTRTIVLAARRQWILPGDGLFASGSARLGPKVNKYIRAIAPALRSAKRIRCVGYTDSLGTRARNRRLGLRRARAVCGQLGRLGIRAQLVAGSRGETRPRATNSTWRGRWSNRRVALQVAR